ncbi:hypothetical protein J1605_017355 [Eschrichtius robustus]|uniref:Phostensin n=1 Tax=Eschrichtius robustus TaxID=9764 RepID=A0AB34I2M9_ESCRO|nr:hypothetical protein J1605_017355 [Eschrichtius robustus]
MATIPDWKLQLLARRRQEEAAVRGREKAEQERLSQMPAWKRGLLERRRAKLGLSPGEPSPAPGTTEAGPPDPGESAVLLEAIGPVHQNRFIRQERQQQQQQRKVGEGEAEKEEAGAQGRPLSALQNRCSVPSPLPPEDAGTGGSRQQEEEAGELRPPPAAPLSPPPPAPPAPQSPGDPLMSRLFYGVKAGPGVGAPRRSGHTFTVNPRRSVPPAAPATPANPATADAAVPGAGKKRYPTAEEILVLGGYLRLGRSCLVKGSPERHHKQLKISFSETALETTYQYPSESSVLEELGPEPEAPSASSPPAAQPDDEEDEEELLLLQPELQGGLRTKALIVDESCRR